MLNFLKMRMQIIKQVPGVRLMFVPQGTHKISALTRNAMPTRFQDHRTMDESVEATLLFGHDASSELIPVVTTYVRNSRHTCVTGLTADVGTRN